MSTRPAPVTSDAGRGGGEGKDRRRRTRQRQLVATFNESDAVIAEAIAMYRRDGGKLHVVAEFGGGQMHVGGAAQAVMEVIGNVSRQGHHGLIGVIAPRIVV